MSGEDPALGEDRAPGVGRPARGAAEDADFDQALALVRAAGDAGRAGVGHGGAGHDGAGDGGAGDGGAGDGGAGHGGAGAPSEPSASGTPPHGVPAPPAPSRLPTSTGADSGTARDPAAQTRAAEPPQRVTSWAQARETAWATARAVVDRTAGVRPAPRLALDRALGLALAEPLTALTDLPSFDTSAMDGWAVAGPGPWRLAAEPGVLAGDNGASGLEDGAAVPVATGARVPAGATAVVRSEHGEVDPGGRLHPLRAVLQGQDIRPRGQECRHGDALLRAGAVITPVVLGLAAAAGYDAVRAVPRPTVDILILGDELLTSGLPERGLIRDALGPMLPPWLRALGAEVGTVRRLGDREEDLLKAVTGSEADLILTTGGTASGPVDHVHPVLDRIGARLLVDGVAVRPGHPMLLAATAPGQHLVGLPGNPLAAVSGLLTLAVPLLHTLAGRDRPERYARLTREAIQGHPRDARLVPVRLRSGPGTTDGHPSGSHVPGSHPSGAHVPGAPAPEVLCAEVLHYNGPAMLRGIAAAEALAVVPPGGARAGEPLEILDLPWADGCFT